MESNSCEVVEVRGREIDLRTIENPKLREHIRKAAKYGNRSIEDPIDSNEAICFGWSKFGAWNRS